MLTAVIRWVHLLAQASHRLLSFGPPGRGAACL